MDLTLTLTTFGLVDVALVGASTMLLYYDISKPCGNELTFCHTPYPLPSYGIRPIVPWVESWPLRE